MGVLVGPALPMLPLVELRLRVVAETASVKEEVMLAEELRFTVLEEMESPRDIEPLVAVMDALLLEVTVPPLVEEKEPLARRVTELVEPLPMAAKEEMLPLEAVSSIDEPVTGAEMVSAGAVRSKSEPAEEALTLTVPLKLSLTKAKPLALAERLLAVTERAVFGAPTLPMLPAVEVRLSVEAVMPPEIAALEMSPLEVKLTVAEDTAASREREPPVVVMLAELEDVMVPDPEEETLPEADSVMSVLEEKEPELPTGAVTEMLPLEAVSSMVGACTVLLMERA
jgi:hypothetical protein